MSQINAEQLEQYFLKQPGAIVAYSGGVDSALLAYAAYRALGDRMVAVLADSASLARREYQNALDFAKHHNIPLKIIQTNEMQNPLYQANKENRCYYCKKALFDKLKQLQQHIATSLQAPPWPLFYGANIDDLGDHRPGIQAAREESILAPYVELGIDKKTIRAICTYYGLSIADKPAMPCMSSRISYGEKVTVQKLSQVEKAENLLYDLGLRILRVRHHGDVARIEVQPHDFQRVLEHRGKIVEAFRSIGFIYVSLDLDGFKSGSLNLSLKSKER
ncbi:MAG: ATP-dependent sacrificial sulfur transferase LarE [Deltaproteobacteria bacterium]|nr:ATP-dependent sacrificial sulfur transferase LarE [Deltaproteobacteria bacterium]MBW2153006.1 ATP-dependent sacrificial sulfur transferase LarE [Deltaproteobacteria bacterium]